MSHVAPAPSRIVHAGDLTGPFESTCHAVAAAQSAEVDCSLVQTKATAEPRGGLREVVFVEGLFEEEMPDSSCYLLLRTDAGWFAHDLDGMLCGNSGSVRLQVDARLRWEDQRLVAEVDERTHHFMEGDGHRTHVLICGVGHDGHPRCAFWWIAERYQPGEDAAEMELHLTPREWSASLRFEANDAVVIGEFDRSDAQGAHRVPDAGRVRISFDGEP